MKLKPTGDAAEQREDLAPVEVVEGVEGLLADEGVALGREKTRSRPSALLDRRHRPVDRHLLDVAGVEVGEDRCEHLGVVGPEAFEEAAVFGEADMLDAEHGDGVGAEALVDELQGLDDVRGRHGRLGEEPGNGVFSGCRAPRRPARGSSESAATSPRGR